MIELVHQLVESFAGSNRGAQDEIDKLFLEYPASSLDDVEWMFA